MSAAPGSVPLVVDVVDGPPEQGRVLVLPPAGGGLIFFEPWHEFFAGRSSLSVVRLPARADLWREPAIDDGETIVSRVAGEVTARAGDGPWTVMGVCTGGLLAYALAHRLLQLGLSLRGLVVQGTPTPDLAHDPPLAHLQTSAQLRTYFELAEPDITDELWEMTEPRIRGDLTAVETYDYPGGPLSVPVVALRGDTDDVVSDEVNRGWARYAAAGFEACSLAGGHFLMADDPAGMAEVVLELAGSDLNQPATPS